MKEHIKKDKGSQTKAAVDRMALYDGVLSEYPGFLQTIRQTETALSPKEDVSLYLRTMVPALFEFVDWVLREADSRGIRRLYFLSRDGYQMYKIACSMAARRRTPVECRYLSVSRYSLRVPAYSLDLENSLDFICVGGIDVTMEKLLQRAALTPKETQEILLAMGWQHRRKEILDYRKILEAKKLLKTQEKLFSYIKRHSEEAYESAVGYLKQEGLMSEEPYALVDSGWVGTMQQSLERLVRSQNPGISLEGFYFGLYELPEGADPDRYHGWYFSPGRGLGRKIYFSNSLFEMICSSQEGMTYGYREAEGRFCLKRDTRGNPNAEQLGRTLKALEAFLKRCPDSFKCSGLRGEKTEKGRTGRGREAEGELTERLFRLLMAEPGQLELESFGNQFFSDDVLEGSMKEAAARLTKREIRGQRVLGRLFHLCGIGKTPICESSWIEGSIARLGSGKRKSYLRHVRYYKFAVYFRKQIKAMGKGRHLF